MEENDILYFVDFRFTEGKAIKNFFGQLDFSPNKPEFEWTTFRCLSPNKHDAINEIIAKLQSLKDIK